jgi:hypothetical protein
LRDAFHKAQLAASEKRIEHLMSADGPDDLSVAERFELQTAVNQFSQMHDILMSVAGAYAAMERKTRNNMAK